MTAVVLTPAWLWAAGIVASTSVLMLAGLWVDDWLRRRHPHGWSQAAHQLGQRDAILAAEVQQLEGHVAHLGAEVERLRHQQAQAATRPPSDPTVRLGIIPGRAARLSRLDPILNESVTRS